MNGERKPGEERDRPAPPVRYPLLVGLAFIALIAYATYNTISNDDDGLLGAADGERGRALAEFAVPDVRGDLVGDANVFQDDCGIAANPCPEEERRTPACRIDPAGVLRVCDFFDLPLAISFWFTGGGDCLPQQDAFDEVAARYRGRVNFLSVNVRDEIEDVREIVIERGWSVPVGWDRDGVVSNIYRVGVCPTLALAFPGGILKEAVIGVDAFSVPALGDAVDELLAESAQRARVN